MKLLIKYCKICGKQFKVYAKWGKKIYCSQPCNYQAWKLRDPVRYIEAKKRNAPSPEKKHLEYLKHKENYAKRARKSNRKIYFGGLYNTVFKRDNGCCVHCGLSKEEHLKKYNRDIEMHHKDDNKKNNSLDNLEVICKKCHNKEHLRYGTFLRNP